MESIRNELFESLETPYFIGYKHGLYPRIVHITYQGTIQKIQEIIMNSLNHVRKCPDPIEGRIWCAFCGNLETQEEF